MGRPEWVLRGTGWIGLALAVVMGGSLVAPGPAHAAVQPAGLESVAWRNYCMEPIITPANPGAVYMAYCYEDYRQFWYGNWDYGVTTEVRTVGPPLGQPNKCLDAWPQAGATNGYRVSTWDCNGADQQKWRPEYRTTSAGYGAIILVNARFGLCLDVHPATRALSLYACHAGDHQLFYALDR